VEAPAVLTKQIGPLPVWAWGAGIGGGLAVGIILRKNGTAAGGSGTVLSTDASGFDPADVAGGTGSFDLGGTVGGAGGVPGGSPVGTVQPDPQGGTPGTKPGIGATPGPPVGAPPHAKPRVGPGPTVGRGTPGVGVHRTTMTEGHRVAAKPPRVTVNDPRPTARRYGLSAARARIAEANERRRLAAIAAKKNAENSTGNSAHAVGAQRGM
jgi:hypothetical protein